MLWVCAGICFGLRTVGLLCGGVLFTVYFLYDVFDCVGCGLLLWVSLRVLLEVVVLVLFCFSVLCALVFVYAPVLLFRGCFIALWMGSVLVSIILFG